MAERVAMISGASRGIGAAIAQRLLEGGWAVSLGMRNPASAPLQAGRKVLVCRFDALDEASEREWVEQTIARFARLDGLVLNAGLASRTSVLSATENEFDTLFNVNVKSPMRLAQLAWPHLLASKGRIVVIASLSGKRVKSASSGLYAMSKFAVLGLAAALRQEGKEAGVRTTAICPAYVATGMAAERQEVDLESILQPEDVAHVAQLALELPARASLPEIVMNWTVEDRY